MSSTKNKLHRAFGLDLSALPDLTDVKLDRDINLEVICIGLPRTGMTSLQAAMTKLVYAPMHHGVELFRSTERTNNFIDLYTKILSGVWKAGDSALTNRLHELMRGYRACSDIPVDLLVKEMYAAYPGAKYVLSTRPGGADDWFKSVSVASWHWRQDWWRTWFRFCIYPVYFLRRTDDIVQLYAQLWKTNYGAVGPQVYDGHNALVKEVVPKEKLLVYDVRDGWEPLCEFLERPVPDAPFPNMNDSQTMKTLYVGMMSFGIFCWTLYGCAVAGFTYVAMNPQVGTSLLNYLRRRVNM